jgi:hypothetical protein
LIFHCTLLLIPAETDGFFAVCGDFFKSPPYPCLQIVPAVKLSRSIVLSTSYNCWEDSIICHIWRFPLTIQQ